MLANLVRVVSTTTGTGSILLGAAVSGCLTFSGAGIANGSIVSYGISDGINSEVGRGTYASSGNTLSRDTVLASTNSGGKINLTGSEQVFITALAEDITPPAVAMTNPTWTAAGTAFTNQPVSQSWYKVTLGNIVNIFGYIHFGNPSGGTGVFTITFAAGQMPTIAQNSLGDSINYSTMESGSVVVTTTNQNKLISAKYNGTTIATDDQYIIVRVSYRI